jgi:hypothetical protein
MVDPISSYCLNHSTGRASSTRLPAVAPQITIRPPGSMDRID